MRARLGICASLAALLLSAGPAAGDSVRLETVTDHGVTSARVVYIGDGRNNSVEISFAYDEYVNPDAPNPQKVIGFIAAAVSGTALAAGPGCEPTRVNEQLCRAADGTRLLAPRAYLGGGNDGITISVPRAGAIVYGGPGNDLLDGPYRADDTLLRSEIHGGPGDDYISATGLVYGGSGDDEMQDTSSSSRLVAGSRDDSIWGSGAVTSSTPVRVTTRCSPGPETMSSEPVMVRPTRSCATTVVTSYPLTDGMPRTTSFRTLARSRTVSR